MARRSKDFVAIGVLFGSTYLGGLVAAAAENSVDKPLPELVLLAPGTQLAQPLPPGWSDQILRTVSRIESGDVDTLPSVAESTASLFRSVILADVRPNPETPRGHRLARIGLGLAVPVNGVDTVVSPQHAAEPPFSLGFLERQVLDRAAEELSKARLVARTPTFALLAAPSEMRIGAVHRHIYLCYAILVGRRDARVTTLLWGIEADLSRRKAPATLTTLEPGQVYRCGLDVIADRILGTIPLGWSFAMRALPPGAPVPASPVVQAWLIDPKKAATSPEEFERLLRAEVPSR
jgi:hypothetical protein